ncbi:uncharacterized protein LOC116343466 [Contarinia nasturtii]|uniref:uncharacterized protein LOC116343466 n=1 Tax=Contarinia nasturtii TaxID=265458 RepID=UPI0012D39B22|nr:uncharacterized protein LOC116343466 [Contarinia nasturtii]
MVLDSKKLLEILRKPIGPACILFVKFLFATFSVALYLFLFPASGLNQFLFILFFDGITNIVIIRYYFVWAVILKGNMELSSLTNLINIALSIGAGNILLLFLKYSPPEMEVFAELCKDSFFYIFVPLCVGFGVGYLITQHISHLTNIIKFLLEVVFSPILIVVSTCVHLTDGLDLYVYRMFMAKSLLIGFIWPFLIYCASLLITRLMKFEPKDRRSITVEVIIANLLCGKWISSFIIWSSPVGDHELADQLYPAMFGMTFMILTAHCIWIYVEGQQKPSKIQYPRL